MMDWALFIGGIIHFAALGGLWLWLCRHWRLPKKEWPFFLALLFWGGLVFASHGAGALNGLGALAVYVPCTFAGLGVMAVFFQNIWRLPATQPLLTAPALPFDTIKSPKAQKWLYRILLGTLAVFAAISLVLGLSVYPDNADSMIYRLPRAVWYASSGNWLHPFVSPDNRLVYYPLDGVMLYVPLVLYGLPGTFHSIPSLISWALVVLVSYRFARELGGDRLLSLFAAWLVGLTPSILAQATSTNDEIIAAAAFLLALYMGWRWLVSGQRHYFLMAGLAVSLSAGTKLHIVFLLPIIAVAALIALWQVKKDPARLRQWWAALGGQSFLATLVLMAIMFAPFLFYNYASTGRFYFFNDFKKDVFNLSGSLQVTFQNLLIYLSQMIFSPIADLNFWPVANDRQQFNSLLNQILNPMIARFIDNTPSNFHLGYRFVGVTLPVSVRFVEFSLWSAFIWLLWPFQTVLAYKQRFALRPLMVLLAATPLFWLVFWSATTLYMEGTATYFTFYLICAAPAAVLVFSPIAHRALNDTRWAVITIVTVTNLIICHNLVMFSGFRALPDLIYARVWPYDWLLTEKGVIEEIQSAQRLRIVFTHEKMPYFGYMHWNPRATYYNPFDSIDFTKIPEYEKILQILPVSGMNMYGFMPLKIPGKTAPGVTYLGAVRAIGREAIFAVGNNVYLRHPQESDYIVLQARIEPTIQGPWMITLIDNPLGFSPLDQLTFEYEIKSGGQVLFHRPESKNPGTQLLINANPHEYRMDMTTIVRSAWSGKEITRQTYTIGGRGMWLPEGSEY